VPAPGRLGPSMDPVRRMVMVVEFNRETVLAWFGA
jgi:hypothetical protein